MGWLEWCLCFGNSSHLEFCHSGIFCMGLPSLSMKPNSGLPSGVKSNSTRHFPYRLMLSRLGIFHPSAFILHPSSLIPHPSSFIHHPPPPPPPLPPPEKPPPKPPSEKPSLLPDVEPGVVVDEEMALEKESPSEVTKFMSLKEFHEGP